jgi:hypothetical protein
MGLGVHSASNRNEYQESSWGKGRPVCKADSLTAICEPDVQKVCEPRRFTTLWASPACYRHGFTFFFYLYLFASFCRSLALLAHGD